MDKSALLNLLAQARRRAERGDFDIDAQRETVAALQRQGLDSAKAQRVLNAITEAQDLDLREMDRLLDEMDKDGGNLP